MIEVHQVSHLFGTKPALDSVTLKFEEGKTHVLLGSSGCGKSTLLKIIMGLIKPTQGTVRVGDHFVKPSTQRELALQIGYVIQEGGLYPHLTAAGNAALVAGLQGWPKEKIQARLNELAELVGFDATILKQYPQNLSGGQRQRVGLIRALMLDPSLLLMDEPLAALDPIIRSDLQNQLKDIFQRLKKTVLFVTHDIGEAGFLGDSVTLMNEGKVIQSGTFSDLIKNPADPYVTRFINAQKPPPELLVS